MKQEKWVTLIAGGFCHGRAPFALHATDRKKAQVYLKQARASNLTLPDAQEHARIYMRKMAMSATEMSGQLERVRRFFCKKLPNELM